MGCSERRDNVLPAPPMIALSEHCIIIPSLWKSDWCEAAGKEEGSPRKTRKTRKKTKHPLGCNPWAWRGCAVFAPLFSPCHTRQHEPKAAILAALQRGGLECGDLSP